MRTMIDDLNEYKWVCLENAVLMHNCDRNEMADSYLSDAKECDELLTLFNEMKLSAGDWARIKELVTQFRKDLELI